MNNIIAEIVPDSNYHIFNRGNNSEDVFIDHQDYDHFIGLIIKYVLPISNIYSWVLMKNHFHFVLHIKDNIAYKWTKRTIPKGKEFNLWETIEANSENKYNKAPNPSNHFRHLFNSYATYFNLKYDRHGSLFEKPFRRVLINNDLHLKNEIIYVNNNPVKHGFSDNIYSWKYSSVSSYFSDNNTFVDRDFILTLFNDVDNLKFVLGNHNLESNINDY